MQSRYVNRLIGYFSSTGTPVGRGGDQCVHDTYPLHLIERVGELISLPNLISDETISRLSTISFVLSPYLNHLNP